MTRFLTATALALLLVAPENGGRILGVDFAGTCRPPGLAPMRLGVTHDHRSLEPWDPPAVVASGTRLLSGTPVVQNQYLMGWGATNPEPSPGVHDWASLDRRLDLIRRTGGTPVITLAGAPDWMKGGAPGRTDWSRLLVAPDRKHYDDFAALAVETAKRYPDVRTFLVWSEFKGFWDAERGRWDAEAYTDLYNTVYRALKQHDPTLQVGGPYLVMQSWARDRTHRSAVSGPAWGWLDRRTIAAFDHWLEHNAGADMVVVDGGSGSRDVPNPRNAEQAVTKFSDVTRWLRSRTDLPIWWVEIYPSAAPGKTGDDEHRSRLMALALRELSTSGAAFAWVWSPQERAGLPSVGLWKGPDARSPGRLTPLGRQWANVNARLEQQRTC